MPTDAGETWTVESNALGTTWAILRCGPEEICQYAHEKRCFPLWSCKNRLYQIDEAVYSIFPIGKRWIGRYSGLTDWVDSQEREPLQPPLLRTYFIVPALFRQTKPHSFSYHDSPASNPPTSFVCSMVLLLIPPNTFLTFTASCAKRNPKAWWKHQRSGRGHEQPE